MGVMTLDPVRSGQGSGGLVVEVDLETAPAARVRAEVRRLVGRCLGIEVDDASPAPARVRRPDHTGGRGLLLVTRLATRWGTDYRDGGKTVWAELDHAASRGVPESMSSRARAAMRSW